jgi:hypothetical protein
MHSSPLLPFRTANPERHTSPRESHTKKRLPIAYTPVEAVEEEEEEEEEEVVVVVVEEAWPPVTELVGARGAAWAEPPAG